METRSHIVLVSAVVALVFAALVGFVLWITPPDAKSGRQYDIVFDRSVSGLAIGSPVSFAGIPVGRVEAIALEPGKPDLVRVRIAIIKDELPMLQGTTATLNGDLAFGSATINLAPPARPGTGPIPLDGEGIGLIPAEGGGLTELAGDPGPLLDRLSRGTDMMLDLTSPAGQREITRKLDASARSTGEMARNAGALDGRIAQTRSSIRLTGSAAADFGKLAEARARQIESRGASLREMRASSAAARETIAGFDERLVAARGQANSLSQTSAALGAQARSLRRQVQSVGATLNAVEAGGVAALSEPTLPDYKPKD